MKVLLVLAMPFLPQATGGTQSSTHDLALRLAQEGHQVTILSGLSPAGLVGFSARIGMKMSSKTFNCERHRHYRVIRKWFVWDDVEEILDFVKPDSVLIQQSPKMTIPTAKNFLKSGLSTTVYLRDVEFHQLSGDLHEIAAAKFIANSRFTADRYKQFGIESVVIPPIFARHLYEVKRSSGGYVTYVNPSRAKGFELALEIAARAPKYLFLFVESWGSSDPVFRRHIREEVKLLRNVKLIGPTSDMRSVYGKTQVLLVPSQWEEAWGRVATEAQFSGIPVIASNIGGLPEAVGPGGTLVDRSAPPSTWLQILQNLMTDSEYYNLLSYKALKYSERSQINPDLQIKKLIELLSS